MKYFICALLLITLFFGCSSKQSIEQYGKDFQKHNNFKTLKAVVELIELNTDTSYLISILGKPINMGFDYRYLTDSISPNNCPIGAVFHINETGKIDQKWIDEICE